MLIGRTGSDIFAVGGKGDAVDGLRVLGERVDAGAVLHVPQPHVGV